MFRRTRRWLKRWLRVLARLFYRLGTLCIAAGDWLYPTSEG